MSKESPKKTKRIPQIKLTKASLVSYSASVPSKRCPKAELQVSTKRTSKDSNNKNNHSSCCKSLKPNNNLPEESSVEVDQFQNRVGTLRKKLEEANCNICTLRAFVINTLDQINNQGKPKDPIQTAEEIKQLLVVLEDIEDQNDIVMDRGMECVKIVEELESNECKCGVGTPSVEAIRKELIEINREQEVVDQKIAKEKGAVVSKVHKSCSVILCPRKPTDSIATGTQLCCPRPENKPKILQTDAKCNVTVGTNPTSLTTSSKGQCAKLKCGSSKSVKPSCCQ